MKLIFFRGSNFNLPHVLFPSFTLFFHGGSVDSWCSFISLISLPRFLDIKSIVLDINNTTLFILIHYFIEWVRAECKHYSKNIYAFPYVYGITQAQNQLVFPNLQENTGGFHKGGIFSWEWKPGLGGKLTALWLEYWLWSQTAFRSSLISACLNLLICGMEFPIVILTLFQGGCEERRGSCKWCWE